MIVKIEPSRGWVSLKLHIGGSIVNYSTFSLGFRWALVGTRTAAGPMIIVSSLAALLLLIGGAFYFRRVEKTFADVV
jgi:hypothetical protein